MSVEARVQARDKDDSGIVGHVGAQGTVVVHDLVTVDEVHGLSMESPEAVQGPLELHDAAVPLRLHHHDLPLECCHPHGQRAQVDILRNHLLGKININCAARVCSYLPRGTGRLWRMEDILRSSRFSHKRSSRKTEEEVHWDLMNVCFHIHGTTEEEARLLLPHTIRRVS